ncbi:MAG: hypothetical protein BGO09_10375 [Bacteroidetes bacterium 47-18]|nr:MAG: hypothetical protein BGO09_10375 [Bacteroidetes bacterium 47-18]
MIKTGKCKDYLVERSTTNQEELKDFSFANGKKLEEAILIKRHETKYWFLFSEWHLDNFYLILYPYDKNVSLAEIHKSSKSDSGIIHLLWTYRPIKQDGKNQEKVDHFKKYYISPDVEILYPTKDSELNDFYNEIFALLEIKIMADNLSDNISTQTRCFLEEKFKMK